MSARTIAVGACIETRKLANKKSTAYDHQLLKLKATKRDKGIKGSPIATATRKPGPRIPTVVGIREVKKAACQPNPCL